MNDFDNISLDLEEEGDITSFINKNNRTIDFIVIITTFRPIYTSAFSRCFVSNLGVHSESWSESFTATIRVDWSNSVNHDWVQVLNSFLPVTGIEPASSRWFPLWMTLQPNALFATPCVLDRRLRVNFGDL